MQNSALKSYLEGNYDIIYVDWGIGTDYIQNNAELLKKAIRWVNQNKIGSEKNVVLGQSMGGLIARYALKDMEDNGKTTIQNYSFLTILPIWAQIHL
jgi:alpha-beta hydrolase superfamily lysophospholipase